MHLGLYACDLPGVHIGAWRKEGVYLAPGDIQVSRLIAEAAERAKLDMVFLADSVASNIDASPGTLWRLEPLTLLSALAMVTKHIGLAATVSTTYSDPFNVARGFASVDQISGGRAGWNVVTSSSPAASVNFGLAEHPSHEDRYARAEEYLDVCQALWDSWEDSAAVLNRKSGVFADMTKRHPINHKGRFFSVEGPLNLTRPPQGHPVIIQAGGSPSGLAFAASKAEVLYTVHTDPGPAKAFAVKMKSAVEQNGRDPAHLKIMPGLVPIIGTSIQDAKAKLAELGSYADPRIAMKTLTQRIGGRDLSDYPLDGPMPELPAQKGVGSVGYAERLLAWAREDNLTIRELRDYAAASLGHWLLLGTPEMIADQMEEWFVLGAADGFNIMPPWLPGSFDEFAAEVIPILQKRKLFRTEYMGTTLRDHLGLTRPPNMFLR